MENKVFYTYNDIHNTIIGKMDQLKLFNPDYIIAIGGGGLIPARIIRSYLNKPILVVSLSSYDDEVMTDSIKIIQWINENLNNKRILIVDEIDETRRTLDFCISKLKDNNNANNIGVFVVHNKLKNKCSQLENINYFSGEDIEDKWVIYPWDITNTM